MRTLICGGRNFYNKKFFYDTLDQLMDNITFVIYGCAWGADYLAERWAKDRGIDRKKFYADWTIYGNAAGNIRNKEMLTLGKPDQVIAFPTGGPGTRNMIRIANEANVPVIIFKQ